MTRALSFFTFILVSLTVLCSNLGAKDLDPFSAHADDVIEFARNWMGEGKILDQVQTIRYTGKLNPIKNQPQRKIVLTLQKPTSQRLDTIRGNVIESVATNGVEGFVMILDRSKPRPLVRYLDPKRVNLMRINTVENIFFLRSKGQLFSEHKLKGLGIKKGKRCFRLISEYPGGYSFERYVDIKTGDIVASIDHEGIEVVEEGDMVVDGIRFPQQVNAYRKGELISSITFTQIEVNLAVDEKLFGIPNIR